MRRNLCEQPQFEFETLGGRLDHQLSGIQLSVIGRAAYVGLRRFGIFSARRLLAHLPLQVLTYCRDGRAPVRRVRSSKVTSKPATAQT